MARKFSKREWRLVQAAVGVVLLLLGMEGVETFDAKMEQLRFDINAEMDARTMLMDKLSKERPEEYRQKTQSLLALQAESENHMLYKPSEKEARFQMQEDITQLADQYEIGRNSMNRRPTKDLYKDSDIKVIRTYVGYNCGVRNLLDFFQAKDSKGYYLACEDVNVSVRRTRVRKRLKDDQLDEPEIMVRGSFVLTSAYLREAEFRNQPEPVLEQEAMVSTPDEFVEEEDVAPPPTKTAKVESPPRPPEIKQPQEEGAPALVPTRPLSESGRRLFNKKGRRF
jgi:hypothetical protein